MSQTSFMRYKNNCEGIKYYCVVTRSLTFHTISHGEMNSLQGRHGIQNSVFLTILSPIRVSLLGRKVLLLSDLNSFEKTTAGHYVKYLGLRIRNEKHSLHSLS